MDNNVVIMSATLSSQGPTGPQGPKGDPGYLVFEIQGNDLVLIENTKGMVFVIRNGQLIMEVN
jgi:hypothetical protein